MATAITTATRLRKPLPEALGGPEGRRWALIGAAVLAELILAAALASGRLSIALVVFIAAAGIAFTFAYPMAAAVITLGLGATIFHGAWFQYAVGPLEISGAEVMLGALFLVALTRPTRRTWGGVAGAGLGIFLLLVAVATTIAVNEGKVDLLGSFAWSRAFLYFIFFYCVVRLFGDPESLRRLLTWATFLAAATGFVALYISVLSGPDSFLQDPARQFIKSEEGLGIIERVRLPGLSIGYALFWYAVVRVVREVGRERTKWVIALVGIGANIAVSFNRNMWVGLAIGLLLMLIVSGSLVRRRLLGTLAVLAIGIAALASQIGPESKLSPLIERGTSLSDSQSLLAEASLRSRENETEIAWRVAQDNSLIGIGPGVSFGVSFVEATARGVWARVPQLFLHNQYLYIWLIAGLPALIAFVTFLLAGLHSAWAWHTRTPESVALGVGTVAIMLSAFVAIYFSAPDMILGLCLLIGAAYSYRSDALEADR